jgi:hypothetical protein
MPAALGALARVLPAPEAVSRILPIAEALARMLPRPEALARLLPAPEALARLLTATGAEERIATMARRLPAAQLELAMRSPLRQPLLDLLFWQLPLRFGRQRGAPLDAAIRWQVTGGRAPEPDVYDLVIAGGRARCHRGGREPAPRMTITIDGVELLRIAVGGSNPLSAYFAGKLAVRGDLLQAVRLIAMLCLPSEPGSASRSASSGGR